MNPKSSENNVQELIQHSHLWLSKSVFPLWLTKGFDPTRGAFVESMTNDFQPTKSPRRAMVQARQIYSCTEALKMKILADDVVRPIVEKASAHLIQTYALPTGAFIHTVTVDGKAEALQSELYTQAFVLFGLARAFELLKKESIKLHALKLLDYLNDHRQAPRGGYTEIKNGDIVFQSNPHMHLFEAVIEWAHVDQDSIWKETCENIFELCKTRFIDSKTGFLAEHFDANWSPLLEKGRFFFEPGHQYEWSWLLIQFERICGVQVGDLPEKLFKNGDQFGVHGPQGFAVDEIWSDGSIKKASSKFWPQGERVKAALEIGLRAQQSERSLFAKASDQALMALWIFLDAAPTGLWVESRFEDGGFSTGDAKASSLYHIINAMSEYSQKRLLLK